MDLVFLEDSENASPTRKGMRPLVATGGLYVPSDAVRPLEKEIEAICKAYNFPAGEEFKWSPGRELWMRQNLVGDDRDAFFREVLSAAGECEAKVIVVIVERRAAGAIRHDNAALDATFMLLERANHLVAGKQRDAVVIADHQGGGAGQDKAFVAECIQTLRQGTKYVKLDRLVLVVAADSKHTRLLQLADLITGCVLAYVSGEKHFAPAVFERIKPLLRRSDKRQIGGSGVKLHPDYRYANLYHWLLGDKYIVRGNVGHLLPLKGFLYRDGPEEP